jgi:flagellar basal body rod protein FlgB
MGNKRMRDLAIRNIHPTVVTINAEIDAQDIDGNTVVLDESKITIEIIRLQAEYDALEYARNRKVEYDALNQFEMQYDDKLNGTTTWDDAIDAIKAKYPKP